MNWAILARHLRALSVAHPVDVVGEGSVVYVRNYNLPPGYNSHLIDLRMEMPPDYPARPPGLSPYRIFVPDYLRYRGAVPDDFHPEAGPCGWAWWCFEEIAWNPCRHDLITLLEVLRATMTDPPRRR